MGIDLALLPVDGDHLPHTFFSHNIISLDRNAIIREVQAVAEVFGAVIPGALTCYLAVRADGERGYGDLVVDPYGDPLQYVLAKHLKHIAKHLGIAVDVELPPVLNTAWSRVRGGDALGAKKPKKREAVVRVRKSAPTESYRSPKNIASFAFICALPDDYKIVLYWH